MVFLVTRLDDGTDGPAETTGGDDESAAPAPTLDQVDAVEVQALPTAPAWPDSSTTGVPDGVVLTPSSGFDITDDGTVIDGLDITGCLVVRADDVTIRNSRIRGSCGAGAIDTGTNGQSGILIEDVEIDGLGENPDGYLLGASGFTCRRCDIHSGGNGIRIVNDVVIEDSYIHDIVNVDGAHFTAIGSNGGQRIVLRHNNIDNPAGGSAALGLYGDFAPIQNVLVENNLFNGGNSYAVYAGAIGGKAFPDGNNVRFIDNRWGREYWDLSAQYGPVSGFGANDPGNEWSGNEFLDGEIIEP